MLNKRSLRETKVLNVDQTQEKYKRFLLETHRFFDRSYEDSSKSRFKLSPRSTSLVSLPIAGKTPEYRKTG